jgi:hypothetical protein
LTDEAGLIAAARMAPQYYAAREDHPLYLRFRGLVLKTSGLVDLLRSAQEREIFRSLLFFGSFATAANKRIATSIFLLSAGYLASAE